MEEEEFNVDIPVLNVFDESGSEHDIVEESSRCLLSFNDLKLVSNKRMLNDTVVHAVRRCYSCSIQLQADCKILFSDVFKHRPFVQVLHDCNAHWVAISTLNCNPGEVFLKEN